MACSVNLSSYSLSDCFQSRGGVSDVWVASWVKDIFTIGTGGTVTGFSSGATWYHQALRRNQSSLTSTYNYDDNAGSSFVSTEATWTYGKMQKEERMQMNALIKGDLAIVVKDANGSYYALGIEEPVKATAGTGETGTERTDANRYSITVTDYCSEFPALLDSSAISSLPE